MKFSHIFSVIALISIILLPACKNEGDAARDAAVERVAVPDPSVATTPAAPTTPEPAQNAEGVWHYTCPSGCEGGAGSATACAKCGATLAHNAAYHNNQNPTTSPEVTPVPPPSTEPPQNSAGVWHYTCPSGCEGGAGSAVACTKCGATLAHNAGYHQ
ncbi:MAG: hypothetical protein R2825_06185 [Saprospiraceae bacterium]